jgi:hypothetical protein
MVSLKSWYLEAPPKKTREGVFVQVYLVMAMKALTEAFLMWQQEQARLHALGKETSWQMYRRRLKMLNRNKIDCLCRGQLRDLSIP